MRAKFAAISGLSLAVILCWGAISPAIALGEIDVSLKLKVDGIVTLNGGGAQIYFDQNHQCTSNRANVSATAQNRDHLISMLITAQTTGKLVNLDLRDTQGGSCNGGSSIIGNMCMGDINSVCFIGW